MPEDEIDQTAAATTPDAPPAAEDRGVTSFFDNLDLGQTLNDTTWQGWTTLLLGIFLGLLAGRLVQGVLRGVGQRLVDRGWTFRGTIFLDSAGPAYLFIMTLGLSVGLAPVAVSPQLGELRNNILTFLYIIALGWFLYNLVDLIELGLRQLAGRADGAMDSMVIPLVRKTLRIFVVIVFALFTAENVFNANVTAWLTGLGIAGLAVSLAAQDSIKNLFGSITIFLDKPFTVGERIIVDNADGTVESIGFRSTKIRTLTGHLVTLPNSKIVDGSVENVARRPHIRRIFSITITYDTPAEKIEQGVQILRDILAEPEIATAFDHEKFPPRVFFDDYNPDSLNLKVFYWFYPNDWWAYLEHAQKINLRIFRAFNDAGIDFAFPTQTIHLANDDKRQLALQVLNRNGLEGISGYEPRA